mgnify:CR=1 FL=1
MDSPRHKNHERKRGLTFAARPIRVTRLPLSELPVIAFSSAFCSSSSVPPPWWWWCWVSLCCSRVADFDCDCGGDFEVVMVRMRGTQHESGGDMAYYVSHDTPWLHAADYYVIIPSQRYTTGATGDGSTKNLGPVWQNNN